MGIISKKLRGRMKNFKPCVAVNREMNLTEIIFEDVPYVAKPLFENVHHWMDEHRAMDDGRLVGFTVWLTKPPENPNGDNQQEIA